jgi:hypothetical protein
LFCNVHITLLAQEYTGITAPLTHVLTV